MRLDPIATGEQGDVALQADDVVDLPLSYTKRWLFNETAIAAAVASAALYKY